jgi:hypothetical protein
MSPGAVAGLCLLLAGLLLTLGAGAVLFLLKRRASAPTIATAELGTGTGTGSAGAASRSRRPTLAVITRSASAASTMSTKVVVHHEADMGPWDVRVPLLRKAEPAPGKAPRRIPSERNHEGRRVVHELIPPKYDPTWQDDGGSAGSGWGQPLSSILSNGSSLMLAQEDSSSYIP